MNANLIFSFALGFVSAVLVLTLATDRAEKRKAKRFPEYPIRPRLHLTHEDN